MSAAAHPGGLTGIRSIFSTAQGVRRARPTRHRHGVGALVLRRQRALRAHGHPQHFLHIRAFAALDQHGTVTAWGGSGGNVPSGGLTGIRSIFSTYYAFAALDQHGNVTAWGSSGSGGSVPSGLTGIRSSNPCSMGMFVDAGACGACPIGYATPAPNETQCRMCTGGKVADAEASISCRDCPLGYYAVEAQPNCTVCSAGRYQDTEGKFSCKNCSVGKYIGDDGVNADQHNSEFDCVSCPKLMLNEHDGASYCFVCPAGWFTQMYTTAAQPMYNCTECPVGWHQRQNRKLGCEECPSGRQALQMGSARCSLCPRGTFVFLGACRDCLQGFFQNLEEKSSCKECSAGFYSENASSLCIPCIPGSFSKSGSWSCNGCPSGTQSEGATDCKECRQDLQSDGVRFLPGV